MFVAVLFILTSSQPTVAEEVPLDSHICLSFLYASNAAAANALIRISAASAFVKFTQ